MMAAATDSTSLVPVQPVFTDAERLALAGFPAGYRGLTREAYTLDPRQFSGWRGVLVIHHSALAPDAA